MTKIFFIIVLSLQLGCLMGQIKPITSSVGQRYPMPEFIINQSKDSIYVASVVKLAHEKLKKEYSNSKSLYRDSTILRLYNYLASVYRETKNSNDSSLYYGKKTSEYAKNNKNIEFEIKGLFQQALYHRKFRNSPEEALRLNLQAYRIIENADHDPQVFWRICYNLGDLYFSINEFDNSLKYFQQSEHLIQSGTGLSTLSTAAYTVSIWQGIANIYNKKRQFELAENYFLKAIEKVKQVSIKSTNAQIYADYSLFLFEQKRINEAIEYGQRSENIWKEIGSQKDLGLMKSNLALFFLEKSDIQTAQKYANDVLISIKPLKTALKNAYKVLYQINYKNGDWYTSLKNFEKYYSLRDSLETNRKNEELYKIQSRFDMERLEFKTNQIKKQQEQELQNIQNRNEIERLKSAVELQRYLAQIKNEKLKRQIETQLLKEQAISQKAFAFQKASNQEKIIKNLKIIELEQNKQIENRTNRALALGLAFMVIIGAILVWYNRKLSTKNKDLVKKNKIIEEVTQKIAETEITALRSQMNPHFIFNCLNSIKLYSLENDSQSASDYLTKFSRLIRLVLENSRSEKVTLENELETLKLYIEMEAMRFKDKVKYQINIAPNIDQQFIEIPPLLIQPFVENSIWHGLMHKSDGGTVKIEVTQPNDNIIHIEILDDGIGREKALEYKSKSAMKQKSFGMKVTNERIELINQIYKTNTEVEIIDLKNKNGEALGTKVILNIPI